MHSSLIKGLSTESEIDGGTDDSTEFHNEDLLMNSVVSFHTELPLPLKRAMSDFIELHPNWDQYRLIQASLAGFLVQNGVESRELIRLYIDNMFGRQSLSADK